MSQTISNRFRKPTWPTLATLVALFLAATLPQDAQAGTTITRANINSTLTAGGAWTGNTAPGPTDIALWDLTISAANCGRALGASVAWGEIQVLSPSGSGVTIANTASAVLSLNSVSGVGIDMSSASQNLTINNHVTLGASQSWTVATGRTLTLGAYTLTLGGYALTLNGAGNTTINQAIAADSGSITMNNASGSLTLAGANAFTGGLYIKAGTVSLNTGTAAGNTAGTIYLGDATIGANVTLTVGNSITTGIANPISVVSGNAGSATINFAAPGGTGYINGPITLNSHDLFIGNTTTRNSQIQGGINGSGNLTFSQSSGKIVVTTGGNINITGNITFNNTGPATDVNCNITGTGSISNIGTGSGAITISGTIGSSVNGIYQSSSTSALVLGGVNSFIGGVTLNSGTLTLSSATALGDTTGTLTINGGVLTSGTSNLALTTNNPQNWNANFTFAAGQNLDLGTGAVALGSVERQVTVNGNNLTVGGTISGTGSLTKLGPGTLILAGANAYTGPTTITQGTLQIGNAGTTGSLNPLSNITDNGTLKFGRSNTITQGSDFGSIIGGTGGVYVTGGGTVVLKGLNTFTGPVTVEGINSYLSFDTIKNVGSGSSALGAPTDATGGQINISNDTSTGKLLYVGTGDTTDRVINLSGKTAGGVIQADNTAGVLQFTSDLLIISATGVYGAKTLTLQGTGTGEFAGAIGDYNTSSGSITSVTKTGTGVWTLSGANSYTGGTKLS